jgi:hypothetical protein
MCAHPGLLKVQKGKKLIDVKYWERVASNDKLVRSHLAIAQLGLNLATLGISDTAQKQMRKSIEHHHNFSHANTIALAFRTKIHQPNGPLFICGGFDEGKVDAYRSEMRERINFCQKLPNVATRLSATLAQ